MCSNIIIKNCFMCIYYDCDELYNYNYDFSEEKKTPLVLDKNGHCFLYKDKDKSGNNLANFDKEEERNCCILGVLQTTLVDKDLQKAKNKIELRDLYEKKYGTGK